MTSLGNNMRKRCIHQRLHQDLCILFFLAPITMKSSRTCKTCDNEHFFRLSNSCTSNLLLLHLSSWIPIEIVEEARTFCILQLHKELTSYSRPEKKHGGDMEHISLQFIMDYVYFHKLLVKAQQAHSGQMLSL